MSNPPLMVKKKKVVSSSFPLSVFFLFDLVWRLLCLSLRLFLLLTFNPHFLPPPLFSPLLSFPYIQCFFPLKALHLLTPPQVCVKRMRLDADRFLDVLTFSLLLILLCPQILQGPQTPRRVKGHR